MRAAVAVAVSLVLASGVAWAEEAPKKPKLKVAVLDVKSAGTIDPKTFEGVSSLIATEFGHQRPDMVVVGAAEIRAMIGFEKEKQLLGCSEGACLSEIGGALGVEYLLATEGLRLGGTWVINMSLIDVAKSKAVARTSQQTKTDDKLVDICLEAVREVARAIPAAAAPVIEARPAEVKPAEAKPVALSTSTDAASPHAVSRSVSWALVGVGVAIAGGGAGCLGGAWSIYGDYSSGRVAKVDAQSKAALGNTLSTTGVVAISVGAAAAVAGVITLFIPGPAAP